MCNETSIRLRNIKPLNSKPGILMDYKVVFMRPNGMADIIYEKDYKESHVVLWELNDHDMKLLDSYESSYNRIIVKVELYNQEIVDAFAYYQPKKDYQIETNQQDAYIKERYIDIICRGCKSAGVSSTYINFLSSLNIVPRKKPSEFLTLENDVEQYHTNVKNLNKNEFNELVEKESNNEQIISSKNNKIFTLHMNTERLKRIYSKYMHKI